MRMNGVLKRVGASASLTALMLALASSAAGQSTGPIVKILPTKPAPGQPDPLSAAFPQRGDPTDGSAYVKAPPGAPLSASDPANASYTWDVLTVGGAAASTAYRAVAADCSVAGAVVIAQASGSNMTWTVAAGHQNNPYAITRIVSATATCTFYGLK